MGCCLSRMEKRNDERMVKKSENTEWLSNIERKYYKKRCEEAMKIPITIEQ